MPKPSGSSKTGGRKKGTPNKATQTLKEKADQFGVDPFEILLRIAKADWKGLGYDKPTRTMLTKLGDDIEVDVIEPGLRVTAAKAACEYIYPKRKAIDHTTGGQSLSFADLVAKVSGDEISEED